MHEVFRERRALYDKGLNDGEIGLAQGVDRSAVCLWRKRRGLKPNPTAGRVAGDPLPMRKLLHSMGWSDTSIGRQQGVARETVAYWRRRRGLKHPSGTRRMTDRNRADQLADLQRRVVRAVGTRLPFDIAADASAALMLAVIEGTVAVDQIEKQARRFGNQALQEYANVFTSKSLDEDIPDGDGLRPVDMLVDGSSSVWLEEMGATVH